jgi:two-component system NtrC family sensor kinase
MKFYLNILLFSLSLHFSLNAKTSEINTDSIKSKEYIGRYTEYLIDNQSTLTIDQILKEKGFKKSNEEVPNFGFINGNVWIRFAVRNNSNDKKKYLLELKSSLIDEAEIFILDSTSVHFVKQYIGQNIPFDLRKFKQPSYVFELRLKPNNTQIIYLRLKSSDQIEVPLRLDTEANMLSDFFNRNFFFGIYSGVMLITIFYNLFIYFSVRDKNYLFYVLYIASVLLTQLTFQGYTFKYLWPNLPSFELNSIHILSIVVGFTSVQFLRSFLQTKLYLPKHDKVFYFAFGLYIVAAAVLLNGQMQTSWLIILCIVSPLSMFMLYISIKLATTGNRSAKIFSYAWMVFLVGVFLYALKDFGVLPYNAITVYTMPFGSAIETLLLSFALSDKINLMRIEKDQLNRESFYLLEENQRIIKEQNITLETMVANRTKQLEESNRKVKEMKSNLINSEKLASIGQLTAGISHEINNPINFITGSISPLRRDLDDLLFLLSMYMDLKTSSDFESKKVEINKLLTTLDISTLTLEINQLLNGIGDGANRTKEIVRSLSTFSRLDENGYKEVNIIVGLESTLMLLNKNIIDSDITLIREFDPTVMIWCNPGKINQVFMNLLTNSIYALNKKIGTFIKTITISIKEVEKKIIVIEITDNGIGILPENLNNIFDPFFTTKEIGEGTGLGLSIVHSIIIDHNGEINVSSSLNHGTTFVLTIPNNNSNK